MNKELESFCQKLNIVEAIRNKGLHSTAARVGLPIRITSTKKKSIEKLRIMREDNIFKKDVENPRGGSDWKVRVDGWDGWKAGYMTGSET